MNGRREHPAAIPGHIPYYYLLLLLPLLRGAPYWRLPDGLPRWWRGAWLDAAVILLLLVLSAMAWQRRRYDVSPLRLRLYRGILWRRTTLIPLTRITTLTIEHPLWLRALRGVRVCADTDAGSHRRADMRLTVWRSQASLFLPDAEGEYYLRVNAKRIGLLCLLSSDSLGGLLLIAAVLRHSSVLLGEGIRDTVQHQLESAADALVLIPRTAALLILIITIGWLAGTLRHLLRHLPFMLCRGDRTLTVYMGRITQRIHCCAVEAIHYADQRQTLAAHLLRVYTVYISCTGYGKDKNTLAVLIPPCRLQRLNEEWELLLPHLRPATVSLRPTRGAGRRYLRLPLALLLLVGPAGVLLGRLFPLWRELILYLSIMATVPCLWLGAVRIAACRTAGVGYAHGSFQLCYARRLTLHHVTLPHGKVACIHLRQSLWQRRRNACDLRIYSHHERSRPHRVRHLNHTDVNELLKEVYTYGYPTHG